MENLIAWLRYAKSAKEQGFSGESELKEARQKVVGILMKIANGEVYSKSAFDAVQKELKELREEYEGREDAYNTMFGKQRRHNEEISRLNDGIEIRDAVVKDIAKFLPGYVITDKGTKLVGEAPAIQLRNRFQCAACGAEDWVSNGNLSGELTYACKKCGESRSNLSI